MKSEASKKRSSLENHHCGWPMPIHIHFQCCTLLPNIFKVSVEISSRVILMSLFKAANFQIVTTCVMMVPRNGTMAKIEIWDTKITSTRSSNNVNGMWECCPSNIPSCKWLLFLHDFVNSWQGGGVTAILGLVVEDHEIFGICDDQQTKLVGQSSHLGEYVHSWRSSSSNRVGFVLSNLEGGTDQRTSWNVKCYWSRCKWEPLISKELFWSAF